MTFGNSMLTDWLTVGQAFRQDNQTANKILRIQPDDKDCCHKNKFHFDKIYTPQYVPTPLPAKHNNNTNKKQQDDRA